jgi:hypothetical protein
MYEASNDVRYGEGAVVPKHHSENEEIGTLITPACARVVQSNVASLSFLLLKLLAPQF